MFTALKLPDFSRRPFFKFIDRRSGPFEGTVRLDRRRVYILPTKTGVIFFILLLLLLIGSVNYGKSLGYMLTFLLVGVGNIAMLMTWRNLAGLHLRAGGGSAVFAGEDAVFAVQLENTGPAAKRSLAISRDGTEYEVVDVPGDGVRQVHFRVRTEQRGLLPAGRFRLATGYPTGLFVAWTWIELKMNSIVYPKPALRADMPVSASAQDGEHDLPGIGLEEFAGLRAYQPGDSWRRVSWKATARSDVLHTKEFSGGMPETQWIDWQQITASGTEDRLSRMAKLVIDAEDAHRLYGIRLPGREIPTGHGSRHYQHCLKALALHGS